MFLICFSLFYDIIFHMSLRLYYMLLYYIVLYCIMLYYIVSYYIVLIHTLFYYIYCIIFCYIILYCIILYYISLYMYRNDKCTYKYAYLCNSMRFSTSKHDSFVVSLDGFKLLEADRVWIVKHMPYAHFSDIV